MMAGTPNSDPKGAMECTMPQCTASQPTLPITNFNQPGGKEIITLHAIVLCNEVSRRFLVEEMV